MNKRAKSNSIRIIAGQWRGRRLPVINSSGLRPSTDRTRETLFNWLMFDVANARCLDLFAGSGALGLECLSRGANFVQFVELQGSVADQIKQNLVTLRAGSHQAACSTQNAIQFLRGYSQEPFDLVFIDPPFASDLMQQAIEILSGKSILANNALIYLEQSAKDPITEVPDNWELHKQSKLGQSLARLYRLVAD